MEIKVAKNAGFCFGVKRAIDMAFQLAKETKGKVCTLGPLIHNPQVVDKLSRVGVSATENIYSKEIDVLLIRTHGIPPEIYDKTKKMSYKVVDATCPFVKKAQRYARMLKEEGYEVVILGDRNHPEVKGLVGFGGDSAIVLDGSEVLPTLKSKIGVVVQTTKSVDALKKVVSEIIGYAKEMKVFNTICNSTANRLEETSEMAKTVDVMIVAGGKNSANTTRLANLCRDFGVPVYHIETFNEIEDEWFKHCNSIGITGGSSTPSWIIDEVVERLKKMKGMD